MSRLSTRRTTDCNVPIEYSGPNELPSIGAVNVLGHRAEHYAELGK